MNKIKIAILNLIVKNLFNGITENDILRHDGQILYQGKRALSRAEVREISNEAKIIKEMNSWYLISNELKHLANQIMYEKSKTIDDMIFGKVILFVVDIIDKKLTKLSTIDFKN